MNPYLILADAIKYLQLNTPPMFRNQGRSDAMKLIARKIQELVNDHIRAVGEFWER